MALGASVFTKRMLLKTTNTLFKMQMDNYNTFIVGHTNIINIYIIFMHTRLSEKVCELIFSER